MDRSVDSVGLLLTLSSARCGLGIQGFGGAPRGAGVTLPLRSPARRQVLRVDRWSRRVMPKGGFPSTICEIAVCQGGGMAPALALERSQPK